MDYLENRTLKIALLKAVSSRIYNYGASICLRMMDAEYSSDFYLYHRKDIDQASREIRLYISDALKPSMYYNHWLDQNYPEVKWTSVDFTQGRLAWIDWMIACYEEDIANYKKEE